MKIDKNIFKSLAFINQIGISMLVPIFLSVYIGNKLDKWLLTDYLTIVFLFLGIFAAFRNVYHLTKSFYSKEKMKDNNLPINKIRYDSLTKEKHDRNGMLDRKAIIHKREIIDRKEIIEDEFNKWAKENHKNSKN